MRTRGFTLIELLVVIAIIGLLASIVLTSLTSAQSKARDSKRLQDMRTIQTALEMYANKNGTYPASIAGGAGTWSGWECGNANDSGHQFMPYLVTDGDLSKVPEETSWPVGTGANQWQECTYRYLTTTCPTACSPSGKCAILYMELENPAPKSVQMPACGSSWIGEAGPGDPNGAILLLPM